MQPGRFLDHRRRVGGAGDADFVVIGFAAVATAVPFLLFAIVGHGDAAGTAIESDAAWQVILAFATMSAGLLFIMHGMRVRDARPPAIVRRAVDLLAVLWHAGGPERLLLVLIVFICPILEAWLDFV